jgi:activating signal cointegrator complex subunit 1
VIPEKAIRPLGTLHLTLGVMSLLTEEKLQGALAVLQGLDLKALLRAAADPSPPLEMPSEVQEGQGRKSASKKGGVDAEQHDEVPRLQVTLKGLDSMHDPKSTSVLYTSPLDASGRLYHFCCALKQAFVDAGYMVAEERKLLLHATIVNTVYVPADRSSRGHAGAFGGRGARGRGRGRGGGVDGYGNGKHKGKLLLDASELLGDWETYVWMQDVSIEKVEICRMGAKVDGSGEERYEVQGGAWMPGHGNSEPAASSQAGAALSDHGQ